VFKTLCPFPHLVERSLPLAYLFFPLIAFLNSFDLKATSFFVLFICAYSVVFFFFQFPFPQPPFSSPAPAFSKATARLFSVKMFRPHCGSPFLFFVLPSIGWRSGMLWCQVYLLPFSAPFRVPDHFTLAPNPHLLFRCALFFSPPPGTSSPWHFTPRFDPFSCLC